MSETEPRSKREATPFHRLVGGAALSSLMLLLAAAPARAYVGPGAGFAVISSFGLVALSCLLAFVFIGLGAVRALWRMVRRPREKGAGEARRVIILGFDGLDPDWTRELMAAGKLPHFQALAEEGCFHPLRTTLPALSPVAWSSFATGCNPGKHRIFDFLRPDRRTHFPTLSSAQVGGPRRTLRIGRLEVPLGPPILRGHRRSKAFWQVLGEQGIFSTVLRVPITFPPEPFHGLLLSGMCVPDLRGSQGHSFFYTTAEAEGPAVPDGSRIHVTVEGETIETALEGPENPLSPSGQRLRIPFRVVLSREEGKAEVILPGQRVTLRPGEYSPWIRVTFAAGWGVKIRGLCQFYLASLEPHVGLYVSPLHLDPEKPALPLSYPFSYSVYLAKLLGPFATLGLAEDTWALNEGLLPEQAFLEQCYRYQEEREKMFWDALEKTPQGTCVCVFDLPDRVQHIFWGPAHGSGPDRTPEEVARSRAILTRVYQTLDDLVGRVRAQIDPQTVLLVLSDHGFSTFERGVNLNTYLAENGYLAFRNGRTGGPSFEGVDWAHTQVYALGLGGLYLNLKGREKQGVVTPGPSAEQLKRELREKLSGLRDPTTGEVAIREVFDSARVYTGPYVDQAPDLIVGCAPGYRVSWATATGGTGATVFEDNPKRWGADHCVHPEAVPGVFFCNRAVNTSTPAITDIAPTVLQCFGVPVPSYMDGKPLLASAEGREEEKNRPKAVGMSP